MRLIPFVLALSIVAPAQASNGDAALWLLSVDRWGNPELHTLEVGGAADAASATFDGAPARVTRDGARLTASTCDASGDCRTVLDGNVDGDVFVGRFASPDPDAAGVHSWHGVRGHRLSPPAPAAGVRRFLPQRFSNLFSADVPPALVIRPGERVATVTVDSGGVDRDGRTRALHGNPQTGPFHVWGARPGDVLAVRLHRLRPDRDSADSLDGFAPRATSLGMAARTRNAAGRVRWHLDLATQEARLEDPPPALRDYTVPLRPMLGGLGVAPAPGFAAASTGDSGAFGGNMDYNGIVEGATVYLPVFQPGALLYLGDGHAVQGDGEVTQWALETSLTVEFSVDVLPPAPLATPRIETGDAIATLGQAGSLDEAVKLATAGMVQWLAQAYGLDDRASALVIGTAAEYRIATLAGRNAGVALRLPKSRLRSIGPATPAARPDD